MVFDVLEPEDPVDDFVAVDLADQAATAEALEQALSGRSITRLVNNVGAVRPALLEDATLDDFDYLMALNVRSAIQCTKALAPGMRAAGFGRIVNVSSRSVRGKELRTNYAATKAALIGLTRTWALELGGDGITVNCICPGPTATELYVEANPPDSPRTRARARCDPRRPHRHARGHGPTPSPSSSMPKAASSAGRRSWSAAAPASATARATRRADYPDSARFTIDCGTTRSVSNACRAERETNGVIEPRLYLLKRNSLQVRFVSSIDVHG